ncbi:MAG: type II toxin-antitoxin system RelE/ParE family toxin [Candidatus Binatia bacterium]
MTRKLRFSPRAARELEEQYTWYQVQRRGLGDEYFSSASGTFESILRNPNLYPVVRPRIRRAPLEHFPYLVFYAVSDDAVTILAIVHGNRHPRRWPRSSG